MFEKIIKIVREVYNSNDFIPLHIPSLNEEDKSHVIECLDSTFVSSVGKFVDEFECQIEEFTGAKKAVATVNGTAALHIALKLVGVKYGDEVICQPFTFIATCNAIHYAGANPVFIDIEKDSLALCPDKLEDFFKNHTKLSNGSRINNFTGKPIRAVVIMHSFGLPGKIFELKRVCDSFNIPLVEDAAESLGSYVNGVHTGVIGDVGVFSFNGNKIITTGGGGMIVTNDKKKGEIAKHLTTTAKIPHSWDYNHDTIGYNYRLPNLNAALGVSQMKKINDFILNKREIAAEYECHFKELDGVKFFKEKEGCKSNYWLNALIFDDPSEQKAFLKFSNENGVMTRPAWGLMNNQKPYKDSFKMDLSNADYFSQRIVNIPSSVRVQKEEFEIGSV